MPLTYPVLSVEKIRCGTTRCIKSIIVSNVERNSINLTYRITIHDTDYDKLYINNASMIYHV